MSTEEIFADTIGEVGLTGPVVRMDLYSLSPTERDENKKPKPVFRQRIVMPVDGFVQSFALMAQVMQQLEKSGVITKKAPAKEGDKPAAGTKPTSANFK
jgi:hypothetical protein